MNTRIAAFTAALLVAAACTSPASGTGQPSPSDSPTPAVTPAPSTTPTPSATPTEVVYFEATKNAEGPHDGPPLLDLPARVGVDYDVHGSCRFEVDVATATSDTGLPKLALTVTAPGTSGTWRFSVAPGSYYVTLGEAVGCTYSVTGHSVE